MFSQTLWAAVGQSQRGLVTLTRPEPEIHFRKIHFEKYTLDDGQPDIVGSCWAKRVGGNLGQGSATNWFYEQATQPVVVGESLDYIPLLGGGLIGYVKSKPLRNGQIISLDVLVVMMIIAIFHEKLI